MTQLLFGIKKGFKGFLKCTFGHNQRGYTNRKMGKQCVDDHFKLLFIIALHDVKHLIISSI